MDRYENRVEARTNGTRFARFQTGLLIACVLSFAVAGPLWAESDYLLGTAKTVGQVGEKADGFIELIDESAPENIKKMVKDTNERRTARYTMIAKKRGTTVESVGKQAGVKILKRVKPGEMIQDADGKWIKK